jgi:integrase
MPDPIIVRAARSGRYWRLWWRDRQGRRRYESIGRIEDLSRRKADAIAAARAAEFARDDAAASWSRSDTTVAQIVADCGRRRGGGSIRTGRGYDTTARMVAERFGDTPARNIERRHATEFRDWLRSRVGEQTTRNHTGRLRTAWADAIHDGVVSVNVWDHLPRGVVPTEKAWRHVTVSEVDAAVASLDPRWRPWLVLARHAGLRANEIARAHWGDFDPTRRLWTVPNRGARTTKRRARVVPLGPEAFARIEALMLDRPGLGPVVDCTPDYARSMFGPACTWGEPLQNLRRSCIADWCSFLAPADVAEIAGNSVDVIMGFYHKVRPETISRITGIDIARMLASAP